MARKVCPACKKLNAGSASACSCGHAFEATSIVAAREAKRCPRCGAANLETEPACRCGYEFDENPDSVRDVLRDRINVGWSMFALGLIGGALGLVVMLLVWATWWGCGLVAAAFAMSIKGLFVRQDATARLRELGASQLPAAKVVRGP